MTTYTFARPATHVLGLSLFRTAEGVKARAFGRRKSGDRFNVSTELDESLQHVVRDFEFSLAVEGSGLLAIEPMGWPARPYRATGLFALGTPRAFAENGAEVPYESSPADGETVDRALRFSFVLAGPGPLPVLRWHDGLGGCGEYVLNRDNPGVVIGLRLHNDDPVLPANTGTLGLLAGSPWGSRTIRFPE